MEQSVLLAHCGTRKLDREELTAIPAPEGSLTHRPIPHHEIVSALIETLGFRQIGIVRDEYGIATHARFTLAGAEALALARRQSRPWVC
jgi:hypothetical protein